MKNKQAGFAVIVILAATTLFAVGALGAYLYLQGNSQGNVALDGDFAFGHEASGTSDKISAPETTPAPFLFQELTIPHLRSRNYESILGELAVYAENAEYTSYLTSYDSDGFRVNGLLTVPKGSAPADGWPAVVFVHGYITPANYRTTENYASFVDFLARRGIVVFKIDLRGHGESEGDPGGGYYSGDYVIDTLNAHAALSASDFVNSTRIGLWGHSMAGNVVFRAFVASGEIEKIVIWAGAVYTYEDFSEYRIQDNSYRPPSEDSPVRRRRMELMETHGNFDPESEFWRLVPATNFLDGVTGAVQIHHAVDDNVVGIDYSRNLMRILENTNISHQLFEYANGGHNMTGPSFTQAMGRTAEFLSQ